VRVEGETRRTIKMGEPLTLTAVVTDDGLPKPPDASDRRPAAGGEGVRRRDYGLRAGWYVYRREGSVTFEPEQVIRPYPSGYLPPPLPHDGQCVVKATFSALGTYVLRAVGDDMGLHSTQDVIITVVP
jgi:hypothetical protein